MEYALLLTFLLLAETNNETTLAERMGFSPDDVILIIHADDVGMCRSVNMATFSAFEVGMIKCGSIMVPCPWFQEVAAYCRENPDADLGIHLTLTSEWKYYRWGPVASKDKVPSLIDEEGFLWRSSQQVQENAKAEEVEFAIVQSINHLKTQLIKKTKKLKEKKRRLAHQGKVSKFEQKEGEGTRRFLRRNLENLEIETMSENQAFSNFNPEKKPFFLFRDVNDNKLKIFFEEKGRKILLELGIE